MARDGSITLNLKPTGDNLIPYLDARVKEIKKAGVYTDRTKYIQMLIMQDRERHLNNDTTSAKISQITDMLQTLNEKKLNNVYDIICDVSEVHMSTVSREERNKVYLDKLDKSFEQLKNGEVVVKTMDELRAMENE